MNGLPADVVELTAVREDGEVLRWVGLDAAALMRIVVVVFQATEGAVPVPDPERSYPWRVAHDFVGSYRQSAGGAESWLHRDRPAANLDLAELLPPQATITDNRQGQDEFGVKHFRRGGRCRFRVVAEAFPDEEET